MKVEIQMDAKCTEPEVRIRTAAITEEVERILKIAGEKEKPSSLLAGYRNGCVELLDPMELITVQACGKQVTAVSERGKYELKLRLYEVEERLDAAWFVRISNSEIVHLRKVEQFDLSFTGTICMKLSNGMLSYVSRRNVAKIREKLGV